MVSAPCAATEAPSARSRPWQCPASEPFAAYDAPVPTDRATARAQVAERGLTAAAAERVVRIALDRLPVPLVARATTQLRRFFSSGSWSAEDDATLAAAVGPGRDWFEDELDTDLTLGFGWRGGAFRVEVRFSPGDDDTESPTGTGPATESSERTLGDTFEDTIVVDPGANPTELRFGIGPGPGPAVGFTRDDAARDPRVAALFRECPDLQQVAIAAGTLTATIADATRWPDVLLPLFDAIAAGFVAERVTPPDRQRERAQRELGALVPESPRDLARIIDATTSPDAAFRRMAIERLTGADTVAGRPAWRRGLEDSSRAVRRATARVLATTAAPDTRDLLEQALADGDACVRYYAVSGLTRIGLSSSGAAVQAKARDADIRVRLAVEAAVSGRVPA